LVAVLENRRPDGNQLAFDQRPFIEPFIEPFIDDSRW
jgi:hypothetical protein